MTALAKALTGRNNVHAAEMPGYGSPTQGGGQGLAGRALALIDQIEQGGQPVHLVGHSFGGAVAMKIARMRPDLVTWA